MNMIVIWIALPVLAIAGLAFAQLRLEWSVIERRVERLLGEDETILRKARAHAFSVRPFRLPLGGIFYLTSRRVILMRPLRSFAYQRPKLLEIPLPAVEGCSMHRYLGGWLGTVLRVEHRGGLLLLHLHRDPILRLMPFRNVEMTEAMERALNQTLAGIRASGV